MLKSGTSHRSFSITSKLIAQNKAIQIIQIKTAIDRNFERFLPKFLKKYLWGSLVLVKL